MKRALLILATVVGFGVIALAIGPKRGAQIVAPSTTASTTAPTAPASAINLISTTTHASVPIVKVVDGDTVVASIGGKNTTLRLIGLDTPEVVDPRKPVQCFGKAASDTAHTLLDGTKVTIEYDPSQGQLDKYGRTLAYIYMEDGRLYNEYMIATGYAHEYTYNLPYRYQTQFKAAETDARTEKRGLWADAACAAESSRTSAASSTMYTPESTPICDRNAYDCASFTSKAEAQRVFEFCGGDANDVHRLDSDRDDTVCESLP